MLRLVIINIILFLLFIVIFILVAFAIGVASHPGNYDKETGATYVGFTFLHIYINQLLMKKQKFDSLRHKTVSTILILSAYIGYLFIYR